MSHLLIPTSSHHNSSRCTETEEDSSHGCSVLSPFASPTTTIPKSIRLFSKEQQQQQQQQLSVPAINIVRNNNNNNNNNNSNATMVKNIRMVRMQQQLQLQHQQEQQTTIQPSKSEDKSEDTPTTPTTTATTTTTNMKRPRQSFSSLEKLESNQLRLLEGTLQEIQKSGVRNSNSNSNSGSRIGKRTLKSPTDWSMNSSIPESGSDLNDLREELDHAESVYSRKTADATFGDEEFSSSSDGMIAGNFRPIPSQEEYNKYKDNGDDHDHEDDPARQFTNHVPSPLRINTSMPPSSMGITNTSMSTAASTPNSFNMTTPQSSQSGGMLSQFHNSNSLLSFPHVMETVTEGKIIGAGAGEVQPQEQQQLQQLQPQEPTATITPSKATSTLQQPEEESATQDTSSPESSSNTIPNEVFIVKGSSASTSRTVVSTTTFETDMRPTTPNQQQQQQQYHHHPQQRDRVSTVQSVMTTPVHSRDWASVADPPRNSFTAPQFQRRHSSHTIIAKSPSSYLKSAQSPVHELVKKQERKRLNLKATIDSVRRAHNFSSNSVDSRLTILQHEKAALKQTMEAEKLSHQQEISSMDHKIKFLQRQHELQAEQQEGVLGLTQTHNKFLKDQLEQLKQECERLQQQHKHDRVRQHQQQQEQQQQQQQESPNDDLIQEIKRLQQGKKRLLEQHEQELTSKQMEFEALQTKLKNLQDQHVRTEKSLQERLQDEQVKIAKLQDRLVQVETVELTIANQKILVLRDQLETARDEKQDVLKEQRAALMREDEKYSTLVQQQAIRAKANHDEISTLNSQVSDLQTSLQRLESLRVKDQEHTMSLEQQLADSMQQTKKSTAQNSSLQLNYERLQVALATVQQERDSLLTSKKEHAQVQEQMKLSFMSKVAVLETECSRLQTTLEQGIASQTLEISKLRGNLDLAENEWHAQQATNKELEGKVEILEQEREELLAAHAAELDKMVNANVSLARNLLKDLAFGL